MDPIRSPYSPNASAPPPALVGRGRRSSGGRIASAKTAIIGFRNNGWPLEEARAHELAGSYARALEIYASFGAIGEANRLRIDVSGSGRSHASAPRLSAREREISALVMRGLTSREIAEDRYRHAHRRVVYRKSLSNRYETLSKR